MGIEQIVNLEGTLFTEAKYSFIICLVKCKLTIIDHVDFDVMYTITLRLLVEQRLVEFKQAILFTMIIYHKSRKTKVIFLYNGCIKSTHKNTEL